MTGNWFNTRQQVAPEGVDVASRRRDVEKSLYIIIGVGVAVGLSVVAAGAIIIWLSVTNYFADSMSNSTELYSNHSATKHVQTVSERSAAIESFQLTSMLTTSDNGVDYALISDSDGEAKLVTMGKNNTNNNYSLSSTPISLFAFCDTRFQFRCDSVTCVHSKLRCNQKRDCPNGEDEDNCTCVDYLKSISPQKVCDGYPDCPNLEDEDKCASNCLSDEFRCLVNGACIKLDKVCDDVSDCSDGADEARCWALAPSLEFLMDSANMQVFQFGYLFGRRKGSWLMVCVDTPVSDAQAMDFCSKLGYKSLISNSAIKEDTFNSTSSFLRISTSSSAKPLFSSIDVTTSCASSTVAYLACNNEITCGETPFCSPPTKRIVGGGAAGPFCHPWAVALYKDGELMCQATVLTNRWLVTAAHCFTNSRDRRWTARLGFYRQYSRTPYEEVRTIDLLVAHPNYSSSIVETNDIALIRMDRAVKFGYHLRPPCTPDIVDESPKPGDKCTVIGWGFDSEKASQGVDELQRVDLMVTDAAECNRSSPFKGRLTDGHLCLTHGSEMKDACQGDSGGALICKRANGQAYMAGVTSSGYGCARPNVPSIWTRLGYYSEFVRSVLSESSTFKLESIANPQCLGFACRYGDCVFNYLQCDKQWNCAMDGDDELSCSKSYTKCEAPNVKCSVDGSCIAAYKLCDYVYDCSDGEDERFCGCEANDTKCAKGGCIPAGFGTNASLSTTSSFSKLDLFC